MADQQQHLEPTLPLLHKHCAVVEPDVVNPTADENNTNPSSSERLGYLFMFIGAFAFAVHSVLIRVAESYYAVPSRLTLYIRGSIHTVCATLYFMFAYSPSELLTWTLPRKQAILLFFRGLSGTVGLMLFYTGVNMVQVGDAISVFFLNPIFVFLLAGLFLSETVTMQGVIAILLSTVGTTLIGVGQHHEAESNLVLTTRIIGLVMIVGGAFMGAVAYTIIRGLGMSVSFMSSVLTFGMFCFVAAFFLNDFKLFPLDELSALRRGGVAAAAGAGFISFIAQCGLNLGLQRCKAGPGVLITNVEVPIVFTLGAIFLHEYPSMLSICGSTLIVSAAVVIGFGKINRRDEES